MKFLAVILCASAAWAQADSELAASPSPREALPALPPLTVGPDNPWRSASSSAAWTSAPQESSSKRERVLYRWSVIALTAANAADAASSWRLQEGNPLLAHPGSQFGMQSVLLKSGFVGASMLAQRIVIRRHPEWSKRMTWVNFATAGAIGAIAHHNAGLR